MKFEMTGDATDISKIEFNKEDINSSMFTKDQLWEAVVRQNKEIERIKIREAKLINSLELLSEYKACNGDDWVQVTARAVLKELED